MGKKKILIFIDWYLPGYKAGGPIQSVSNLVSHFKDQFDFYIVTRDTDYCEVKPYITVVSDEWNTLPDGTSVFYFSKDNLSFKKIKKIIQYRSFDHVYLNGIFSLYFTIAPLIYLQKKREMPIIVASRGMFAESALNVKKTKKQLFIRVIRALKLFNRVTFHATNKIEEQNIINALGENVNIKIAANLPAKNSISQLPGREKNSGTVRLINVARIAPEKNLLFALQILKNVISNVEFDFYGPVYNQEYWSECKQAMDELPVNIKANYKGSLPSDEVLIKLNDYHFMFMPTKGENFGHIILQALSSGCPVIISDQTPWNNLSEKQIGWDISLDKPENFVEIINKCAKMGQLEFNQLSENAFEYAHAYNTNSEIIDQNRLLLV